MAQGDGAAVDVDLAHIEAQLTGHGDGLGSESLVGLHQVHVLDLQAGLLHGLTGGGHGAHTHDLGVHAALAPADQLGHGLQAVLLHGLARGQDDGGSAVVDAGGVGGGDALDVLLGVGLMDLGDREGMLDGLLNALRTHGESAAQLGDALGGHAGAGELVHLELHHLLLLLDHHGDDLVVEAAGVQSGLSLVLGGGGELVQLLTGDAPHVADVLGGGAHVIVVERIPQTVADHGVDDLLVTHAGAPALLGQGIGGSGHILHAAGHHDVGIAGEDGAAALDDGLHAGAAHHTHGVGGGGQGHAGLHSGLTGGVLAQGGGEDAAEHDLVHVLGGHVGPLQGLLDDQSAQLYGGSILQRAAIGADGSAAAVNNINFLHHVKPPT